MRHSASLGLNESIHAHATINIAHYMQYTVVPYKGIVTLNRISLNHLQRNDMVGANGSVTYVQSVLKHGWRTTYDNEWTERAADINLSSYQYKNSHYRLVPIIGTLVQQPSIPHKASRLNNNIPALVQIMAWRRPGDKPLSERMIVSLLTHICVTRPQWVDPSLFKFQRRWR